MKNKDEEINTPPNKDFLWHKYQRAQQHNGAAKVYLQAALSDMATFIPIVKEPLYRAVYELSSYGHRYVSQVIEPSLAETEDSLNLLCGMTDQYEYKDACHTTEWDWQQYGQLKRDVATLRTQLQNIHLQVSVTLSTKRLIVETRKEDDAHTKRVINDLNRSLNTLNTWHLFDPDSTPGATHTYSETHELVEKVWSNHRLLIAFNLRLTEMVACFESWREQFNDYP